MIFAHQMLVYEQVAFLNKSRKFSLDKSDQ